MILPKTLREEIGDRAARTALLENLPLPADAREVFIYLAFNQAWQDARTARRKRAAA